MQKLSDTFLIVNGKSAHNDDLRKAVADFRQQAQEIDVRVTWEKGDGYRYVIEALAQGATTVVAGGGDGTISEIANALVAVPAATRPVLGILPLGTANDFAISAGIPLETAQALRLALTGRATAIDLVRVNTTRYFINMATGGFGTRITRQTPARLKSALGGVSYFIHGLVRMDSLAADHCVISGPGFHWQGNALIIGIGNGRQAGGGQLLCPSAFINDNQLALSIITAEEAVPALLNTLFRSRENNNTVVRASLPSLTIHASHEVTFNLDGEPLSGTDFRIEIIPGALRCRLPLSCTLLK